MAKKTPQQVAEKYQRNASASVVDWQQGVENVVDSPMEKAAKQKDKMLQNVTASIQNGKWERGLKRVSLQDWKDLTVQKGASRYPQGVTAGAPKMEAFMQDWLPHMDKLQSDLKQMPNLTLEDSIARMTKAVRHAAGFKR